MNYRMRREKCELCVLSWKMCRGSLEAWACWCSTLKLRNGMQFCCRSCRSKTSFCRWKNQKPPLEWDTAIIIHCRWMGSIRWFASSLHAVWVGVRAEEEFTFCSAHLPSWVSDDCFEHSVEEVLEAGRSKANGSIFLGIDANCNIDDSDDQRGVLVRELCAVHNLLPLFQRFWTLALQSPTGVMWKKKVDFCFSN